MIISRVILVWLFPLKDKSDQLDFYESCFWQYSFTSSVIGYHQKTVVMNVKGLPVQSRVCFQCLVMKETPLPPIPLIDNWELRILLPGVRHHQENLMGKKIPTQKTTLTNTLWTHLLSRHLWLYTMLPCYPPPNRLPTKVWAAFGGTIKLQTKHFW